MQFINGIFVTPPRFDGEEFQNYPNERAMLRNAVSELRFVCWRWLLALGYEVKLDGALLFLVELRAISIGEPLNINLGLVYSWLQILGKASPREAKQTFYDFNQFSYVLYENLNDHVSTNTKRPTL